MSNSQTQNLNSTLKFIITRLDEVSTRLDEVSTRLDEVSTRLDEVSTRLKQLENKFDRFNKTFEGYINKESEIFELKTNDFVSRHLSKMNKHFKELHIGKLYSPRGGEITDFDGFFVIDYIHEPNIKSFEEIKTQLQIDRQLNNNSIKAISKLKQNAIKAIPNPWFLLIEAKHDIDKSKIDSKIIQFVETIRKCISAPLKTSNNYLYQTMVRNSDFILLRTLVKRDSIVDLYFSADNWTQYLRTYVETIFRGDMTEQKYIELTNNIINTHDKKLLQRVYQFAELAMEEADDTLKTYIQNFSPECVYINQFNLQTMSSGIDINKFKNNKTQDTDGKQNIANYISLMISLQKFTRPYETMRPYFDQVKDHVGIICNFQITLGRLKITEDF